MSYPNPYNYVPPNQYATHSFPGHSPSSYPHMPRQIGFTYGNSDLQPAPPQHFVYLAPPPPQYTGPLMPSAPPPQMSYPISAPTLGTAHVPVSGLHTQYGNIPPPLPPPESRIPYDYHYQQKLKKKEMKKMLKLGIPIAGVAAVGAYGISKLC